MRKIFVVIAAFLVLAASAALYLSGVTQRHPKGEVDFIEEVELGGMKQWIMANGSKENLPVLLWLHGGPGSSQMPVARYFNSSLESNFIVVHWDQRGAGKSNANGFDESTMTFEQFVWDTHELTLYLKARFHQEKIYLLGHSWGSQIGLIAASRYPGDYIAYIGVAQIIDSDAGQGIAAEELTKRMIGEDRTADLTKLYSLYGPPFRNHDEYVTFAKLLDQYHMNMDIGMDRLAMAALGSGVYSLKDFSAWLSGATRGSGPMWEEMQSWNAPERVPQIDIPVFFISGDQDYNAPLALVQAYCDTLEAPLGKEVIVFPGSAHTPFFADAARFKKMMDDIQIKTLH